MLPKIGFLVSWSWKSSVMLPSGLISVFDKMSNWILDPITLPPGNTHEYQLDRELGRSKWQPGRNTKWQIFALMMN